MPGDGYWRGRARRALESAMIDARAKGLNGAALATYVRAHGYPFGLRENHPYKIWLREARKLLGPANSASHVLSPVRSSEPLRVMTLRETAEGREWLGRVFLGEWIRIQFGQGHLAVAIGQTREDVMNRRYLFRERIAEKTAEVCDLREAIEILEGTGAFDFSAIDLAVVQMAPPNGWRS